MRRRQFALTACALGGLTGCLSTGVNEPAENTSEPNARLDNQGAISSQSVIDEVVWRTADGDSVELVIRYHDDAPGFIRLVDPSGSEVWRQEDPPAGGEDTIPFGLPVGPQGDWLISTTTDGDTENLALVVQRQLGFIGINLNVDELTVSAQSTGTVPTRWVSYIIYTGAHSKTMPVGKLLLPGDTHEVTHTYPFDQYEDVRFHLFDGQETYDQQRIDLL